MSLRAHQSGRPVGWPPSAVESLTPQNPAAVKYKQALTKHRVLCIMVEPLGQTRRSRDATLQAFRRSRTASLRETRHHPVNTGRSP
jgi:hypothetical protein